MSAQSLYQRIAAFYAGSPEERANSIGTEAQFFVPPAMLPFVYVRSLCCPTLRRFYAGLPQDDNTETDAQFRSAINLPFLDLHPVFGNVYAHVLYVGVAIVLFAWLLWWSVASGDTINQEVIEKVGLPATSPYLKIVYLYFALAAVIRLVLTRIMVFGKDFQYFFRQHLENQRSQGNASPDHVAAQELRTIIRWGVISSLVWPPLLIAGVYVLWVFVLKLNIHVYSKLALPLLAFQFSGIPCTTAISCFSWLCRDRIRAFSTVLMHRDPSTQAAGLWTRHTSTYLALEGEMTKVCRQAATTLLVSVSSFAPMAWVALVFAMEVFPTNPTAGVVLYSMCGALCIMMLFIIYPLAGVTELGTSLHSQEFSLIVCAVACAELDVRDSVWISEYLKFLAVVKTLPLGVKMPLVGLVSTQGLVNFAKALGTVLPLAVAYSMSMWEKSAQGLKTA